MKNRKVTAYIKPNGDIQQISVERGERVSVYVPTNRAYVYVLVAIASSNVPVIHKNARE